MGNDNLTKVRVIIESPMLADTVIGLARKLGYRSRSTLYRVLNGKAGDSALNDLYDRIRKAYGFDLQSLNYIYELIIREREFRRLINDAFPELKSGRAREIVDAFVLHRFAPFKAVRRQLTPWLRLEEDNPTFFYMMLAYFYVREIGVNIYRSGRFFEECARVMESLGAHLEEFAPELIIGNDFAHGFSNTDLMASAPESMITLLSLLGFLINMYARPDAVRQGLASSVLIKELGKRSYWRSRTDGRPLLLLAEIEEGKPGSGSYNVYRVDPEHGDGFFVANLIFFPEGRVTVNVPGPEVYQAGTYKLDEKLLIFDWGRGDENPLSAGNFWDHLEIETSQTLKSLDKRLTNEILNRSYYQSIGYEAVSGAEVDDVIISRKWLRLKIKGGKTYEIATEGYEFMKHLRPSEPVMLFRSLTSGNLRVQWTELFIGIPLEKFTEIEENFVSLRL